MKKILIPFLLLAPAAFAAVPEDSRIFTPYFDMKLTESGYMPSNGNIFSGANIDTRVGLLARIADKHSIFALYNYDYSGPAFHPQDTRQFTERSMTHTLDLEYRWVVNEKLRVRPAYSYAREYRRAGSNESWENGLYNSNSNGGQISVDYTLSPEKNSYVTFCVLSRLIKFPNYTDLLAEFMNASASSDLSGGLQDQTLTQYSVKPSWNGFFGGIYYTTQKYKNQKVVDLTGVYGGTKQKDTDTKLDFGFQHKLWIFKLYPTIAYTKHNSNQNFMKYRSIADTNPEFMEDAYSYKEWSITVPIDLDITGKWTVGGQISIARRIYDTRHPRNANNDYLTGVQKNLMSAMTGSISKKINELASVRLFYSITVASSNNRYEAYMPYNYVGNSFGLTYVIAY